MNHGFLIALAMVSAAVQAHQSGRIGLHEIDLSAMTSGTGRGTALANRSVAGGLLSVAGRQFDTGVGTRAFSTLILELDGCAELLTGWAGADDAGRDATVRLHVLGDRRVLWDSGLMRAGEQARPFSIPLAGVRILVFLVTDAGDGNRTDFADWLDVSITYRGRPPAPAPWLEERPYLLTPPPPVTPRINGPMVVGARPGSPFQFRIPCTGERPIAFGARGLPAGLKLDETTGMIRGRAPSGGRHAIHLEARNAHGASSRAFTLVIGDQLALTPPMGWNSWYAHKRSVTDAIIRGAAEAMIASGMADFGYDCVSIDDCWSVRVDGGDPATDGPSRDAAGRLLGNRNFPDMKALAGFIHSKGLKAGLYSSPGRTTCAGFAASYEHEAIDARTFAEWGYDLLKYDWCSYEKIAPNHSLRELQRPFRLMAAELGRQDRDIVFTICQYGMGKAWTWAGGMSQVWRTTDDLGWKARQAMPGFFYVGRINADYWEHARPGQWNDPDYILAGYVRDSFRKNEVFKADLSPSEHYFYMSMWSLMAAPLVFGGDIARLDPFLLNVLCNHEVIAINQDPSGSQGRVLRDRDNQMIMVKELEGGAKAIGLFHITGPVGDPSGFAQSKEMQLAGIKPHATAQDMGDPVAYVDWGESVQVSVSAAELDLSGRFRVRDVWRQLDLGEFSQQFTTRVPFHGASLLRIVAIP